MKLSDLVAGECGRVVVVSGVGALRRRLMDMGVTPGTKIYIRKVAPLGDPVEINVRGYELSLRKEEIANIDVQKLPEAEYCHLFCHACFYGKRRHRKHRGGFL